MVLRALFAISLAILLTSCSVFRPAVTEEDEPQLEYPGPDSEILRMLDDHRGLMDRQMGIKIATIKDTLRFDKPEGALGNMVSDAIRNRAGNELGRYINMGIIGESSFKLFFEPGQLTLGELYEFMPYDNHLVVLTLSGDKVYELVNQVAALGGAPVSGVRFRIDEENRARGVLVNSEVIDPDKKYRIATSSWAANGGDVFPALWEAEERIDLDISVRSVYIDYFRGRSEIYDFTDGRIRK